MPKHDTHDDLFEGETARRVTIFEVGPRDGLQNEHRLISPRDKIKLVNMLSDFTTSRSPVSSVPNGCRKWQTG